MNWPGGLPAYYITPHNNNVLNYRSAVSWLNTKQNYVHAGMHMSGRRIVDRTTAESLRLGGE